MAVKLIRVLTVFLTLCIMLPSSVDGFWGQKGCDTIFSCLASVNRLVPYRLNLNPITMVDRLVSHKNGRNGWTFQELHQFDRTRNLILRTRSRAEAKRKLHRARMTLLQGKIQRMNENLEIFKLTNVTNGLVDSTSQDRYVSI